MLLEIHSGNLQLAKVTAININCQIWKNCDQVLSGNTVIFTSSTQPHSLSALKQLECPVWTVMKRSVTIWQPMGERNSNWCKVPTAHCLTLPLWQGWRWLERCELTQAFTVWCWDLRLERARRSARRAGTRRDCEKTGRECRNNQMIKATEEVVSCCGCNFS